MGKINLKQIDGFEIIKVLRIKAGFGSNCFLGSYEFIEEKINYDGNYALRFSIDSNCDGPIQYDNMVYINIDGEIWCNLDEPYDETEAEEEFSNILTEWIKTAKFEDIDYEKKYMDLKKAIYMIMPGLSTKEDFDCLIEMVKTAKIEYTRWKKLK